MGELSYSHLEAMFNIVANGLEILMISICGPLLFVWWVPHVNGTCGYRLRLFLLGLVAVGMGVAAPGVINGFIAMGDSGTLGAVISSVLLVLVALPLMAVVYFLPSYFALRVNKKANWKTIVAVNLLLGAIPPIWLISLGLSTMPDKLPATTPQAPTPPATTAQAPTPPATTAQAPTPPVMPS